MSTQRIQRTLALTARGALATGLIWLLVAALSPARTAAQLPLDPVGTPFEMTAFIQKATIDDPDDLFSGGSITLNNHTVVIPRNTIFQMPATALTWQELFKFAPPPYGPTQSGLALQDSPKPLTTFEVTVQGNRIGDTYIAGLVFIAQNSLHVHQGFINFIDYTTGELRVGGTPGVAASGTRVRINDPIGRFGRAWSYDVRFTIDEDNPTIKTETAYPMCVPRVNPAAAVPDALCPKRNRPTNADGSYQKIFTMPRQANPAAGAALAVAKARDAAPALGGLVGPDPWRMAPFQIGDYISYSGQLVKDDSGADYIAAWGINANVGIFTTPGTRPAYVAIDALLMGTGPTNDVALAQEGAKRTRVEGFTTDISTAIIISAVDVEPCTGSEVDRPWTTEAVDPGPPNGAVAGRWRFRPGAPLFDLTGFPFLPGTRELHAVTLAAPVITLNGLSAGEYTAPNFEFIFTENRGIGNPKVPGNYDALAFLSRGSGPWSGGGPYGTARAQGIAGPLSPFPRAVTPAAPACAGGAIKPPIARTNGNQKVTPGTLISLRAGASSDPNTPPRPLTYSWQQISGPAVNLATASTRLATFTAPALPALAASVPLGFLVTVDNGTYASTAAVTVTVQP